MPDDDGLHPLTVPLVHAEQALDLIAALLEPIDQRQLQARLAPLVEKVRRGAVDPDTMLLIRALAMVATTFALAWATAEPTDDAGALRARSLVETLRTHYRAADDLARLDAEFPFREGR